MFHEIEPHVFNNDYKSLKLTPTDYLLIFQGNSILINQIDEKIKFPKTDDIKESFSSLEKKSVFLFSIDDINYFLITNMEIPEELNWKYENVLHLKEAKPMWKVFVATLGSQLNRWYVNHTFCGRCGARLETSEVERALQCPDCGLTVYPTIAPSVIVAITNKDKILLTKYAQGAYKKYALVAGYAEVGETLEQTVEREVMEEVGLKVKNITYYKTQPWPFTDTLLAGYFAELDGDDGVTLQESELSEATWFCREDIPMISSSLSLTNEMIELFKNNIKLTTDSE